MKYAAVVNAQVIVKFDPPDPDVPFKVRESMTAEEEAEVLEGRVQVAKYADDMVVEQVTKALVGFDKVVNVQIIEVAEARA